MAYKDLSHPQSEGSWQITQNDLAVFSRAYPDRFSVNSLKKNIQIDSDHEYLHFDHYLYLSENAHVTSLPDGLSTSKTLVLRDCSALESLPRGLRVGIDLDITNCISLRKVPRSIQVAGNIYAFNAGFLLYPEAYVLLKKLQQEDKIHDVFGLLVDLNTIDPSMESGDIWRAILTTPTGSHYFLQHYSLFTHIRDYRDLLQLALTHATSSPFTLQ